MAFENCYEQYQFSDYFKTDLPLHWNEKRLGFLAIEEKAAFVDGPFGSDLKSNDYIDDGIPLIQLNNIRDSKHLLQNMKFVSEEKKLQLIRHIAIPGDVVIAKMADPVARAAIVNEKYSEYVIVADCVKFTPNLKLINVNYLVWAINCDCVRVNAELVSTGTTRVRINLGELKKLKIPYPPTAEQRDIANFLDHETAKIDTLIAKQQGLINLLKEKRQAVISHAITKGLNSKAPMRDSSVEWLGEVPAHWEMLKGAYIGRLFGSESVLDNDVMDEGDIPFIKVSTLDVDSFNLGKIEFFLISKIGRSIRTNSDYIVFPKRGAAIFTNKVNIVSRSSVIDPNLMGWAIGDRARAEFVAHLLKFRGLKDIADVSTVPQINNKHIEPMKFPIPPIDEQDEIIEFLRGQLERFNHLCGKAEEAIELMTERRTALISAAVTGKIDVRDWVQA